MKIAIGADHAGYDMKQVLLPYLTKLGYEVVDLGTDTADVPSDYPDYARLMGAAITSGQVERGVLVCGSGVGVSVAANKIPGVYAALCHDTYSAHQGVEHDKMNVICIGARIVGSELAREIVKTFLAANFSAEERHIRRTDKIHAIETEYMTPDHTQKV